MSGAHTLVDVDPVGGVANDVSFGAQRFKDGLGDHPGGAVGTVQSHAKALVGMSG